MAHRLKSLRIDGALTQSQLAKALGVSPPLISSWETAGKPDLPPAIRINAYARLFCTDRSVSNGRVRMLDEDELDADERARRRELEEELLALRDAANGNHGTAQAAGPVSEELRRLHSGPLYFADGRPVTIVCARLPRDMRKGMPYTDPSEPDYTEAYTLADLDTLLELQGHIRAANPLSQVVIRADDSLTGDDLTTHLVLLGGVDWNFLTRSLLDRLDVPVTQVGRLGDDETAAAFQVRHDGDTVTFAPRLIGSELVEDVAHFYRAPNPYNRLRTVTIFNGMFGRGTYGAVRSLTDERFRDRNGGYLASRFADRDTFSILTSVQIVRGEVLTPDWTVPETRLHEWPGSGE
ncbi:helix-turn-helix transcriptional regulator [Dactylosporangium sucinum]|uniref:helix-turn-helix transcriptional regulator n=1 Tax=Dactylosporangium sucinum TaxID=1424081 RepID=UPI001E321FC0|nr:helix-turn-helix domain-containing protein [Dactylosporangium sucinum]